MRVILRWAARLVAAALSAAALLVPLGSPTHALWMARVGVTEWGHLAAPAVLAFFVRPWRRLLGAPLAAALSAAGALALVPLAQALPIARLLRARLAGAFGPAADLGRPPLSARELILGARLRRIPARRITFARRDEADLVLDFYRDGDGGPPRPLVVVIHGGAWQGGDSTQLPDLNHYLAARGYAVAAVTYRLAPRYQFPAAYEDVVAALAFLKDRAVPLGIDAGRIALLGRSAGGHLALLAAYRRRDPSVRGAVALYPPADLRFGHANPAPRRVIDSTGVLEAFLGGSPATVPETYDAASPLTYIGPDSPPTLLVHGTRDEMAWPLHSRRVAGRMAEAGRPCLLLELPWASHGCDANLAGPSGQLSRHAVEAFLAATLG